MAWKKEGKAGERERFGRAAVTYVDHLYRVAFHLAKEENEAQDLVQETYARAFESWEQFTPGTNMKAWLTRILYNFFFDHYNQSKRRVSVGEEEVKYWETVAGDDPGPEGRILHKELNLKITEALRNISEEFRVPIILVDIGDFSYAEAAEILSCPVGTIRSRLSRGRRLMQKLLEGYVSMTEREKTKNVV